MIDDAYSGEVRDFRPKYFITYDWGRFIVSRMADVSYGLVPQVPTEEGAIPDAEDYTGASPSVDIVVLDQNEFVGENQAEKTTNSLFGVISLTVETPTRARIYIAIDSKRPEIKSRELDEASSDYGIPKNDLLELKANFENVENQTENDMPFLKFKDILDMIVSSRITEGIADAAGLAERQHFIRAAREHYNLDDDSQSKLKISTKVAFYAGIVSVIAVKSQDRIETFSIVTTAAIGFAIYKIRTARKKMLFRENLSASIIDSAEKQRSVVVQDIKTVYSIENSLELIESLFELDTET